MLAFQNIKNLLAKYNLRPNKILGQNFLMDENAIGALVETAEIEPEDIVVEVGPGTGAITKLLAQRAKRVIAVEKDKRLIPVLQKELAEYKNTEIINADILKFQPNTCNPKPDTYILAGAPPYYLTARLFRHFLQEMETPPVTMALIIQKEVAEKITARPPHMNLLAISVQLYGMPKIKKVIKKGAFWPRPKVDSAIITVKNIEKPHGINEKAFFRLVRAGFSSPRKQLAHNIAANFKIPRMEAVTWLISSGIDPTSRAETLTLEAWRKLYTNKPSTLSS